MVDKLCPKCKQVRPITEFSKDSQQRSGLASWCKACQSVKAKNWWSKNREIILPKLRMVAPQNRVEQKSEF